MSSGENNSHNSVTYVSSDALPTSTTDHEREFLSPTIVKTTENETVQIPNMVAVTSEYTIHRQPVYEERVPAHLVREAMRGSGHVIHADSTGEVDHDDSAPSSIPIGMIGTYMYTSIFSVMLCY